MLIFIYFYIYMKKTFSSVFELILNLYLKSVYPFRYTKRNAGAYSKFKRSDRLGSI